MIVFETQTDTKSRISSIATLVEELKPVGMAENEFENRDSSIIIAL